MRHYLFLALLIQLPATTHAEDFIWYFAEDGADPGNDCTRQAYPCRSLGHLNDLIDSMVQGTDTATVRFARGDTWTLTGDNQIVLDKSQIVLDAYGTGPKPTIDGALSWPSERTKFVLSIGNSAGREIEDIHVNNLRFQNLGPGSGIRFSGTLAGGYFRRKGVGA